MFKILNEYYYLDLDEMAKYVQVDSEETQTEEDTETEPVLNDKETQVHLVKYDTCKMLLEVILFDKDDVDEKLGTQTNELSIPFKLAFNSLLNKKIINKL